MPETRDTFDMRDFSPRRRTLTANTEHVFNLILLVVVVVGANLGLATGGRYATISAAEGLRAAYASSAILSSHETPDQLDLEDLSIGGSAPRLGNANSTSLNVTNPTTPIPSPGPSLSTVSELEDQPTSLAGPNVRHAISSNATTLASPMAVANSTQRRRKAFTGLKKRPIHVFRNAYGVRQKFQKALLSHATKPATGALHPRMDYEALNPLAPAPPMAKKNSDDWNSKKPNSSMEDDNGWLQGLSADMSDACSLMSSSPNCPPPTPVKPVAVTSSAETINADVNPESTSSTIAGMSSSTIPPSIAPSVSSTSQLKKTSTEAGTTMTTVTTLASTAAYKGNPALILPEGNMIERDLSISDAPVLSQSKQPSSPSSVSLESTSFIGTQFLPTEETTSPSTATSMEVKVTTSIKNSTTTYQQAETTTTKTSTTSTSTVVTSTGTVSADATKPSTTEAQHVQTTRNTDRTTSLASLTSGSTVASSISKHQQEDAIINGTITDSSQAPERGSSTKPAYTIYSQNRTFPSTTEELPDFGDECRDVSDWQERQSTPLGSPCPKIACGHHHEILAIHEPQTANNQKANGLIQTTFQAQRNDAQIGSNDEAELSADLEQDSIQQFSSGEQGDQLLPQPKFGGFQSKNASGDGIQFEADVHLEQSGSKAFGGAQEGKQLVGSFDGRQLGDQQSSMMGGLMRQNNNSDIPQHGQQNMNSIITFPPNNEASVKPQEPTQKTQRAFNPRRLNLEGFLPFRTSLPVAAHGSWNSKVPRKNHTHRNSNSSLGSRSEKRSSAMSLTTAESMTPGAEETMHFGGSLHHPGSNGQKVSRNKLTNLRVMNRYRNLVDATRASSTPIPLFSSGSGANFELVAAGGFMSSRDSVLAIEPTAMMGAPGIWADRQDGKGLVPVMVERSIITTTRRTTLLIPLPRSTADFKVIASNPVPLSTPAIVTGSDLNPMLAKKLLMPVDSADSPGVDKHSSQDADQQLINAAHQD